MKIKEIFPYSKKWLPAYAEDLDNVGLWSETPTRKLQEFWFADAWRECIGRSYCQRMHLVVCFHPILFSGIKITAKLCGVAP
jgi:putative NIF3 family GTP cyclohydrolase 1 type 2